MIYSYLILIYLLTLLFGASLASFYHLYFYRRQRDEDFILKRSFCESCNKTLKFYDLIPIFSYVFNRGRCRYCGAKIGLDKFVLEILSGILAVFVVNKSGVSIYSWLLILEIVVILFIGYIDYATTYIYNVDLLILFVIEIILKIYFRDSIYLSILDSFILGAFFIILYKISGMMGLGDAMYALVCGFILRDFFELFLFFNISFISCAIISLVLIILKKKNLKSSISFGPYMSFSLILLLILR